MLKIERTCDKYVSPWGREGTLVYALRDDFFELTVTEAFFNSDEFDPILNKGGVMIIMGR